MQFIKILTKERTLAQRLVIGAAVLSTLSLPAMAQRNQRQADPGGQSSFQARQDIRRAQQVQQPVQTRNDRERSESYFKQRLEDSNRRAIQAQQEQIRDQQRADSQVRRRLEQSNRRAQQAQQRALEEARVQQQRALNEAREQAERDRRAAANAARISRDQENRRYYSNPSRHPQYYRSGNGRYRNYGWNNNLDNRRRYQAYLKYRNDWNQQRAYLRSNLARFNQLALLNQAQQQQLDNQMRQAWLSYHNNQWTGPYGWNYYNNPQFIDYLHTYRPSLLQTILSYLGLGSAGNYLYSPDWDVERDELAYNMARIHQLAAEGRITRAQEQMLMDQLRAEFMAYHNNTWSGPVNWAQYSDPNFIDYVNNSRPSLLSTVRNFLIR